MHVTFLQNWALQIIIKQLHKWLQMHCICLWRGIHRFLLVISRKFGLFLTAQLLFTILPGINSWFHERILKPLRFTMAGSWVFWHITKCFRLILFIYCVRLTYSKVQSSVSFSLKDFTTTITGLCPNINVHMLGAEKVSFMRIREQGIS